MKKRPKIKTSVIIWEKETHKQLPRDAEIRRWIYHNGKRGTQYHVDEIPETGEIQNTYIYKYTTEGIKATISKSLDSFASGVNALAGDLLDKTKGLVK